MSHVDSKKGSFRPGEFEICSCHPVEFKKLQCPLPVSLLDLMKHVTTI